jgi:HEXXH motif-containing protein
MTLPDLFDLHAFDPSPKRARAAGARMQSRLADSLRYILGETEKHFPISHAGLEGFIQRLGQGPVHPLAFGAYCELVLAIESGDFDKAGALMAELATQPNIALGPTVTNLEDPAQDASANRYCRLSDTDADIALTIRAPAAEEASRVQDLIDRAFILMRASNPALAGEVREIVREIVLAIGPDDPKAVQFDGISSFMLWGAVILNVQGAKSVLDMVQTLAHESGHNLLFALCAYGPLHDNDDSERYASPLRTDIRPMDGIVHATYVTARMHQAVQRLLDAGALTEDQAVEAGKALAGHVKGFASGMETVSRHAKLTPLGREVMDGAIRYMSAYR